MVDMQSVTYIEMDYGELDELAYKLFPNLECNCIAANEWSNDSSYTASIDGELDEWDEEEIKESKEKTSGFLDLGYYALLNLLCREKIIEPGEYLINVSW